MTMLSEYDYLRPSTSAAATERMMRTRSYSEGAIQLRNSSYEIAPDKENNDDRLFLRSDSRPIMRPLTAGGWNVRSDDASKEAVKFRSDFPNLPGFRKNATFRSYLPKNQTLNFSNGSMMVKSLPSIPHSSSPLPMVNFLHRPMTTSSILPRSREVTDPNDVSGRYSLSRRRDDRQTNGFVLPFCPTSQLPDFLRHDRRVLLFHAYFEEDVSQSALEVKRIRVCKINVHAEDGTIEIILTKQENSGIPHGVFLGRSRVVKQPVVSDLESSSSKREEGLSFYQVDDFKLGNVVEIYGRRFHIVDCNESTRRYVLDHRGWDENDVTPRPFPLDSFTEASKERMKRESGKPGYDRNRKMNDLKRVMESMLGKQTSTTDRGMFLECGHDALCFRVVWDDRERLYGDLQYFKLAYFLADDTIEIVPVRKKNDGRDKIPKLLKRSKLPKDAMASSEGKESQEFYTWNDLSIGMSIDVFGRPMALKSCDKFTRDYYESKGKPLDPNLPLEPEEDKVVVERQIPPHNGFGSEEDSLRTCTGGINPPPAKKDLAKMRDKLGIILKFNAHLVSHLSVDHGRRFVIQYFMEDDTIAIREPPIRNSGVIGGKFLRRQIIKKLDGTRYQAKDMYVGNKLEICGHRFVLLNAEDQTYKIMENDDATFPYSNLTRLHDLLTEKKDDIKLHFFKDYRGDGKINQEEFADCCHKVGLELNRQEIITLWRKLDKKNKGKVSFSMVIKMASEVPYIAPMDRFFKL